MFFLRSVIALLVGCLVQATLAKLGALQIGALNLVERGNDFDAAYKTHGGSTADEAGNERFHTTTQALTTSGDGYNALCIVGAIRSMDAIKREIYETIIQPLKKDREGVDVFIISSLVPDDFNLEDYQSAWKAGGVNVKFRKFEKHYKKSAPHQYHNWSLCQEEMEKTGTKYHVVGKTRTDIVRVKGDDLGLHLIGSKKMVIANVWYWPFANADIFPKVGDFAGFGTPADMKVYFNTLDYWKKNKDSKTVCHGNGGYGRWPECYLISNLVAHNIKFVKPVLFDKVFESGRRYKEQNFTLPVIMLICLVLLLNVNIFILMRMQSKTTKKRDNNSVKQIMKNNLFVTNIAVSAALGVFVVFLQVIFVIIYCGVDEKNLEEELYLKNTRMFPTYYTTKWTFAFWMLSLAAGISAFATKKLQYILSFCVSFTIAIIAVGFGLYVLGRNCNFLNGWTSRKNIYVEQYYKTRNREYKVITFQSFMFCMFDFLLLVYVGLITFHSFVGAKLKLFKEEKMEESQKLLD